MAGNQNKTAINGFLEISERGSDIARSFCEAYGAVMEKRKRQSSSGDLGALISLDGQPIDGPNILYYLHDAVELYERRKDERKGQTVLLFDKRCFHMRSLREIIKLLKTEFPDESSKEHQAALAVERSLDAIKIPGAFKQENDVTLHVSGLRSGWDTEPAGKGVVIKEYGEGEDIFLGRAVKAVIEIGSEALWPHLCEPNVIGRYVQINNPNPVDIAAVTGDGKVYRFNASKNVGGKWDGLDPSECLRRLAHPSGGTDSPQPEVIAALDALRERDDISVSSGTELSAGEIKLVEQEILPFLVRERPASVNVSRGR